MLYVEVVAQLSIRCFGQRDFWEMPGVVCGFHATHGVRAGLGEGREQIVMKRWRV